jgi:hypothetical protein
MDEKVLNQKWKEDYEKRKQEHKPRGILASLAYISREYDKAERERMNKEKELRAKFLTSEERRQLQKLRNYKLSKNLFKIKEEENLVSSDYSFLQEGDILSRLEEKVSQKGWMF